MTTESTTRSHRIEAELREEERVTPLELFFDLVFVLAITQCTQLMSDHPTWEGLLEGILVLGVLWWCWVGYAWLTSVLNPEEGAVRIVIFAAMAALLIVSLCVPEAFGDLALTFAIAYGFVRAAHIALFVLASREDPGLRKSVTGLAISTTIGVGLLAGASALDGPAQLALWGAALFFDMFAPLFFIDASGWRLMPEHFAERHGLIMIIALGESIVAIGLGAGAGLTAGQAAAAVLGIALISAMWWLYFDIVAIVSARRLADTPEGLERNELARDSYSYMHFPMVAGIVLVALGLKKTLGNVDDPLSDAPAFALLGGVAFYLLGLVGFRLRHVRSLNRHRFVLALALLGLVPVAFELPAIATVGMVTVALAVMIAYETRSYGENRSVVRHGGPHQIPSN